MAEIGWLCFLAGFYTYRDFYTMDIRSLIPKKRLPKHLILVLPLEWLILC